MPLAPNTLPARAFQRSTRTSRLLFHWRASDLSLTPVTGEAPTFVRASGGGLVLGSDGKLRDVAQYQPRWGYAQDPVTGLWTVPGLRLEGQRTNLVIHSDDITGANGWSLTGGVAGTAAFSRVGTLSLTRLTGINAGAAYRNVALTGNGVKSFACVVQFDGVPGTTDHGLYDATAAAVLCRVTVTWAADGSATAAAVTGTLLSFTKLTDQTYLIRAASVAATAANTNAAYAADVGACTATSVRVGGMQVEDAVSPSSLTQTGAAAVARAEETLSWPFLAPPRGLTAYLKYLDLGNAEQGRLTATTVGLAISNAAGAAPQFAVTFPNGKAAVFHYNGVSSVTSVQTGAVPSFGDSIELRLVLGPDGAVTCGQSVNGAAETVAAPSAALALAAAWSGPLLWLGAFSGAAANTKPYFAAQILKLAADQQTMAYLRSAF